MKVIKTKKKKEEEELHLNNIKKEIAKEVKAIPKKNKSPDIRNNSRNDPTRKNSPKKSTKKGKDSLG